MASEEFSFVECYENVQSNSQRNIFSVPAVLSRSPNLENSEEYVLLFMCEESQKSAILKPAFLTTVQKDGATIDWSEARDHLQSGYQVKIDVVQSKSDSLTGEWLVFGLYLEKLSIDEDADTQAHGKDSFSSQRRSSKEFEWLDDKVDGSYKVDLPAVESKLVDFEDNVAFYSNEFDKTEKSLIKAELLSEPVNDCVEDMHETNILNDTFTVEDGDTTAASSSHCKHKYEVDVVVVSVKEDVAHLVGPVNDLWMKAKVELSNSYVKGVKVREANEVDVGAMGVLVLRECIHCQVDVTTECLPAPIIVWFGEEHQPQVRGEVGKVVWREDGNVLVEAGSYGLVLFSGNEAKGDIVNLESGWTVLVWAWKKEGKCGNGVAWVRYDNSSSRIQYENLNVEVNNVKPSVSFKTEHPEIGMNEVNTDNSAVELGIEEKIGSDGKTDSDKSSDISFGSVSECEEVVLDNLDITSDVLGSNLKNKDLQLFELSMFDSFKDDIDIDLQFNEVLVENGLMNNYGALAKKYEEYVQDSKLVPREISALQKRFEKVNMDSSELDSQSGSLHSDLFTGEMNIVLTPPMAKKLSQPSLSPILEEEADPSPMFSTPVGTYAQDSGYLGNISGSSNLDCSRYVTPSTNELPAKKDVLVREVLEKFLGFTQFPVENRNGLIDLFISNMKDVAFN